MSERRIDCQHTDQRLCHLSQLGEEQTETIRERFLHTFGWQRFKIHRSYEVLGDGHKTLQRGKAKDGGRGRAAKCEEKKYQWKMFFSLRSETQLVYWWINPAVQRSVCLLLFQ